MKHKLLFFIFTGLIICNDTLVIIGNRIITKRDFIERAEYTIRPDYCKSNNNIEKKIILNSLISEKILALENKEKNLDVESYHLVNGIKEQMMRKVMLEDRVNEILKINNDDLLNLYTNSQFEYKVDFLTFSIENLNLVKSHLNEQKSFEDLSTKINTSPSKQFLTFFNCDNLHVRENLFNQSRFEGELIGPIQTKSDEYILIKINKSKKTLTIDQTSQMNHYKRIKEIYVESESRKIRKNYILDIMSEKKIVFNESSFIKLANSYLDNLSLTVLNPNEIIFMLNEQTWKIEDLIELNKLNPILFRESFDNKADFYNQFKLAIVDIVQNHFLTKRAYELNYDNNFFVKNEYYTWIDYILADDKKEFILNNNQDLNIYLENLFDKYSSTIIIDVQMFDEINLSNIDMFVINKNQPYQLKVPPFPKLTTKNTLDYGVKKES